VKGYDNLFNVKDGIGKYEWPYGLEPNETAGIEAIQKMLEKERHKSEEVARDHFQYLENKLTLILSDEQNYGIDNESLPENISVMQRLKKASRTVMSEL
jgi:hypothetical protein